MVNSAIDTASCSFTLEGVSAMPAPTWHRLQVNDATIMLPCDLASCSEVEVELSQVTLGSAHVFDEALAAYQERLNTERDATPDKRAVVRAAQGLAKADDLDAPALSTYQKRTVLEEVADDVAQAFDMGMGSDVSHYLQGVAQERFALVVDAGKQGSAVVRLKGHDKASTAASFDIVLAPHAHLDLLVSFDSPDSGRGVLASDMRVYAGPDSSACITSLQTLDESWTVFDNSGFVLDSGASVEVHHKVLGGARAYTGLAADLRGENSHIETATRYIGLNKQERDFNYVVRHRGKATTSALDANGVLAGQSKKVLRGTIDFLFGCKGAEGNERETVLLADEKVENRTVPVILCDEDDVMGNHGATIGHVRPEQRFYLATRGFSEKSLEHLFIVAALEEAYLTVCDEQARQGIERFASGHGVDASEFSGNEGEAAIR